MSLVEFPPLNVEGRPFAIQEFNGRIVNGSLGEFKAVRQSDVLADFPSIEKAGLGVLHHGISTDNKRSTFPLKRTNGMEQAWDRWATDGFSGVVDHVASVTESTKLWPIAKLGRGVLKLHNGVSSMASKILPTMGQERICELVEEYGHTLNWKNTWLRCVAIHEDGKRMAICQHNNYIRVYRIGIGAKKTPPLTIRNQFQKNVTCMAWDPYDQRTLAVAAGNRILLWKLITKSCNIQSTAECFRVIEVNTVPITQLVWDRTSSSELMAISPNSNKIMLIDTTSGEVDLFGAWTGGSITRLVPTSDGRRIAVLYTTNMIRVYDRMTWSEEKWGKLHGRATDAVWSPNGDCLLFSCENDIIYSIPFVSKIVNVDGHPETTWIGHTCAVNLFDLSPVEFDPSQLEVRGSVERPACRIGGKVKKLAMSPDGQRLVVSFKGTPSIAALFIVDWSPVVRLIPSGLLEAPGHGDVSIVSFMPTFRDGSLLFISWSGGQVQYIPLIYGANSAILIKTKDLLNEVNSRLICSNNSRSSCTESGIGDVILPASVSVAEQPSMNNISRGSEIII